MARTCPHRTQPSATKSSPQHLRRPLYLLRVNCYTGTSFCPPTLTPLPVSLVLFVLFLCAHPPHGHTFHHARFLSLLRPPPFFRIHFLSDASFVPATRQPPFPLCIVTPSPPTRLLLRRRTRPTAPTTLLSPSPTRHKRRWSRSYTATTSLDGSVTTSTPTSSLVYDHRQAPSTPG